MEEEFILEVTGVEASSQNVITESPNKYTGNMMQYTLHSVDLGPEYWLLALQRAGYVKQHIPHAYKENNIRSTDGIKNQYNRLTGI